MKLTFRDIRPGDLLLWDTMGSIDRVELIVSMKFVSSYGTSVEYDCLELHNCRQRLSSYSLNADYTRNVRIIRNEKID